MYSLFLEKQIGPGRTFSFRFENNDESMAIVSVTWKFESRDQETFRSGAFIMTERDYRMDVFKVSLLVACLETNNKI